MGRDANNGIFPIAWAIVFVENKENWKWFLETLSEDLQCWNDGNGLVLISDQHKVCFKTTACSKFSYCYSNFKH